MAVGAPSLLDPPSDPFARPAPDGVGLTARVVAGPEWDRMVADFDGVCQEQLHSFARHRWPGVVLEPVVFDRAGGPVAGALMMIQPLPLRVGAIAVSKWAPVLKDNAAPDRAETLGQVLDWLMDHYARRRAMMLSILPRASQSIDAVAQELFDARGFRPGNRLAYPDRYIVDIRMDDGARMAGFGQKWRYHLRRALKNDLDIAHVGADRLPEFATLYRAMTARKRFPDYSAFPTLPQFMAEAPEAVRPELFLVRKDDRLVAGAVIFKAGDTATYLYGATNDDALELRAGYALHWHIMRWLRDHTRAHWYDLGGTDGFSGLHQFKQGMVGTGGMVVPIPPVANYAARPLAWASGRSAFAARELLAKAKERVAHLRSGAARPDRQVR